MKKGKELEINYRAYTLLLLKQKLPLLLFGLTITFGGIYLIFKSNIIRTNTNKAEVKKTAPKAQTKTYFVEEDEDLWQIAEKHYGSGFNAYDIAKANGLKEPYILQKGQVLIIPDVTKRSPTQGELTPEAASTERVLETDILYTVEEGDYLFDIAQRAYGDGNLMQRIIDANAIPYPYDISVGMQLTIPR